ncbi:MAG: zinc-ribbon domain-containing protein [Coprobacillus sp.]
MENKEFVKLLGIIYDTKTCDKCHEEVRYQVIIARTWKTLFIPIFPVSKEYYLSCPKCDYRILIDKAQARKYLDTVAKEKKNHNHKER